MINDRSFQKFSKLTRMCNQFGSSVKIGEMNGFIKFMVK